MTERETESRRKPRARGHGLARWVYGSLLVAIGACIGIVIGSVSDTPRVFLERMRGPVDTIELPTGAAAPAAEAAPPLEAFGALQGAPAAKAPAKVEAKAEPKPEPKPEPKRAAAPAPAPAPGAAPAPAVASPPPVASAPPPAAPAKSAEELVQALAKKTEAAPGKGSVIQVLSLAERKQADALVAKLSSQGYESYVTPMPDKSGRFRVRVRPGSGQTAAELEPRLKALGLKTWITAE